MEPNDQLGHLIQELREKEARLARMHPTANTSKLTRDILALKSKISDLKTSTVLERTNSITSKLQKSLACIEKHWHGYHRPLTDRQHTASLSPCSPRLAGHSTSRHERSKEEAKQLSGEKAKCSVVTLHVPKRRDSDFALHPFNRVKRALPPNMDENAGRKSVATGTGWDRLRHSAELLTQANERLFTAQTEFEQEKHVVEGQLAQCVKLWSHLKSLVS